MTIKTEANKMIGSIAIIIIGVKIGSTAVMVLGIISGTISVISTIIKCTKI
ncbi:MAG: hypothetical protein J6S81_03825 [Treponema sp.]|nr:hypothetical protein [Treponema sp.]